MGLLLIAYVAGSLYFTDRFMPNTVLGDHDVSLKTSSEVQAILDDALSDYTVAVSGQGFSMKLSAKDAGVSFDGQAIVADALGNTNPWLWPLEITREHDGRRHPVFIDASRNLGSDTGKPMSGWHSINPRNVLG